MSRETCPHCGAKIDSGITVCPNCRIAIIRKSRAIPYFIIGCIILVAVVIAVAFLLLPAPQPVPEPASNPVPQPAPLSAVIPAAAEVPVPTLSCTIAITGSKIPPATIRLQVMSCTCFAGDVTGLRVRINGEEVGTLAPDPGSGGSFTGTSGPNNVIVVAAFASGAESVIYQNAAL
jgi:predicted nucleic acid-binding Zn ribbon protein